MNAIRPSKRKTKKKRKTVSMQLAEQLRKQQKRLKRRLDAEFSFVPRNDSGDITADREKGASKTFSHRTSTELSARAEKRIAAEMIRCPKDKNRAGLYDVITIKDDDGDLHTHKLCFNDGEVPEVFKLFRGKRINTVVQYRGYKYTLIKIEKEAERKEG